MNRTILLSAFAAALAVAPLHAEPKTKKAEPMGPPTQVTSPKTPRIQDFQGDDLSVALRTLARSANLNIVISDQVTGTVTMRIEDRTPREAIQIIADTHELILDEKKGILYVRPKNPPPLAPPKATKSEEPLEEALTSMLTPALIKFYDSLLDYLIAEGFTKDEAFRIILTNQELSIPDAKK